jgi:hypothetical protein
MKRCKLNLFKLNRVDGMSRPFKIILLVICMLIAWITIVDVVAMYLLNKS